jgi:hypothetical protein
MAPDQHRHQRADAPSDPSRGTGAPVPAPGPDPLPAAAPPPVPVTPTAVLSALATAGLVPADLVTRARTDEEAWSRSTPLLALVALTAGTDLTETSDGVLVEIIAACDRLRGWQYAAQAAAAAELASRDSMNPAWSPAAGAPPGQPCVAGDEIAMRLRCSRRAGLRLVQHGRSFETDLHDTGAALADGRIGTAQAMVIADRLAAVPAPATCDVQDLVLPSAGERTVTQVARDVDRALVVVDPAGAAHRHALARRGRRVERPRALADGMAGIWSVLPATQAAGIDADLDAAARAARAAGDPRTLDQLRADRLCTRLLRPTCSAHHPPQEHPGPDTEQPTGTADPVTALAPDSAASTQPPATGAEHRTGCDCPPPVRADVRVTVALSTLLGLDELPADLDGYGAIDPVTARALAAGGTWRRLVTDPTSGTVLDVGRTRYRPPEALADHVRHRDLTCVRPGCTAPARSCDLDHTVPFHPGDEGKHGEEPAPPGGGPTAAHNLGPLCRRDHRLKTDGGYTLRQPAPGVFDWETPTSHGYRTTPGRRPTDPPPSAEAPGRPSF